MSLYVARSASEEREDHKIQGREQLRSKVILMDIISEHYACPDPHASTLNLWLDLVAQEKSVHSPYIPKGELIKLR